MRMLLLLPIALATMLVGARPGQSTSSAPFCAGRQLSGSFRVVRGSAGAGNIVYALRLENRSGRRCSVTGLPAAQLLDRADKALPTHVLAARPGALTPVLVVLRPGQATRATARFSPDVPGPGEPRLANGQCEPSTSRLGVLALGGGATTVPVSPPTPVCEHGSLRFSAYGKS
jgi:hypothetical protein